MHQLLLKHWLLSNKSTVATVCKRTAKQSIHKRLRPLNVTGPQFHIYGLISWMRRESIKLAQC